MSRKQSAIWGYGASVFTQIIMQVLMVIAVPLYLDYVGDERYGFWLAITSAVSWISMTDFGIGMALTREIARERGKSKTRDALNRMVGTALLSYLVIGVAMFVLGLAVLPFLRGVLEVPGWFEAEFNTAFTVALIASALYLPFSTFSSIIEANQKMVTNRTIDFLASFLGLTFSVAYLIISNQGVVCIALGMMVKVFVKSGLTWWYARSLLPLPFFTLHALYDYMALKRLYSYGGYFQLIKIANMVATTTDNLIVATVLGASFVTDYSITSKLGIAFGIVFASKIGISLLPGLSELFAQEKAKRLNQVMTVLLSFLFRLSLLAAVMVYFVNPFFVDIWVGSAYFGGDLLNFIFAYWAFFETIIRGGAIIMYANGDIKGLAYFSIAEVLLNLVLSFLLGWSLGLVGVALATAISRTFTIGIYFPYFLWTRRIIGEGTLIRLRADLFKGVLFAVLVGLTYILIGVNDILFLLLFLTIVAVGNVLVFDYQELKNGLLKGEGPMAISRRVINKYNPSV